MKSKILVLALAFLGLAFLAQTSRRSAAAGPARVIAPPNESEVELTVVEKGVTYKLYRGELYRVNAATGKWEFVEQIYHPDFYAKNYVERDGAIFRKGQDGQRVPVRRSLTENFEHAQTLRDLIGLERGWTGFTLQSPKTPTVKDYVALRKRILKGESDFLDNRVEPSSGQAHSGKGALKTVSLPSAPGMVCAKAELDSELLHFGKGDDVWFSGWYLVPEGSAMPFTLMDLETTWIKESPGMRIAISGSYAAFQLKWGAHPYYRQPRGREVPFPAGRWVHLKAHLKLSDKEDGVIELWQDEVKIIDARGQTLPLAHTIYNSLEIGITAYNAGPNPAILYVDDVAISDRPLD